MPEPRRHHLVPRFFLNRFAKKKTLVMIERNTGRRITSGVKDATVQCGFYTLELADGEAGTPAAFETLLSRIEDRAAPAIERLVSGGCPPRQEDRLSLGLFMAVQILRGEDQREAMRELRLGAARAALDTMPVEYVRQQLRATGGKEPDEDTVARVHDAMKRSTVSFDADPGFHMHTILRQAPDVGELLCIRDWQLWKFDNPRLLTGDRPVGLWRAPENPYPAVGVANADQIHFPLDPQHALVLAFPGSGELTRKGTDADATRINRNLAFQCFRWVIHRATHDPLAGIRLGPRPPLFVRVPGPRGEVIATVPNPSEGVPVEEIREVMRRGAEARAEDENQTPKGHG